MAFEAAGASRIAARTRNFLQSVVLVGGIGVVMAVCAWVLWGKEGVIGAFISLGILILISPRIAPELLMRMYGATRIRPESGIAIAYAVEELAKRAKLPATPKLYLIESPIINGFATGVRSDAIIAVTRGMINQLDVRELIGVLAHETSHIMHNDLWILSLADTMSRFTYLMSLMGVLLFLFSLPMALLGDFEIPWLGILLLYFAPTISGLLQLGLSRAREYDADREGAWLSGDPEGLASALQKIENYQGRVWETIFVPGRRLPVPSLLRTHPSTEERVRRLRELPSPELPPLQAATAQYLMPRVTPLGLRPRYRLSGLWY